MSPLGSFDVLHGEISTIFPLRKIKSSSSFRKEIISNFVGLTIISPITGCITRESMITYSPVLPFSAHSSVTGLEVARFLQRKRWLQ